MSKIDWTEKYLQTLNKGATPYQEANAIIACAQVMALLAIAEQMEKANMLKEKELNLVKENNL